MIAPAPGYAAFLARKGQVAAADGFAPTWMPGFLFDFQAHLVDWSARAGRAAILADCGLGKTPMQLAWAQNVVRRTNRPVLVATPLAVGRQTVAEAEKFGVEAALCRDGRPPAGARVVVTNYERLHHFDPAAFAGAVCDESSILKSFDGRRRGVVTEFLRGLPYRLLCTATPAPNDYTELGTSSEALGYLGHMDMLGRFFKNDGGTLHIKGMKCGDFHTARWRFKRHAERDFWRWVCSWARAIRRPSDLGFADGRFVLPPLETSEVLVGGARPPGALFDLPATTLREQREERRRTLAERCRAVAELLNDGPEPAVAWCHLNDEGDELARLIDGAEQVAGSDPDGRKEELFEAFAAGQVRVLVTKPTIAGFGLNWQHCARQTFFPSHSFEQFYQAVRRSWRFGQSRPVRVAVVASAGEAGVLANLRRKAEAAEAMFAHLLHLMNDQLHIAREEDFPQPERIPAWL